VATFVTVAFIELALRRLARASIENSRNRRFATTNECQGRQIRFWTDLRRNARERRGCADFCHPQTLPEATVLSR
jgi:hypothetical protein